MCIFMESEVKASPRVPEGLEFGVSSCAVAGGPCYQGLWVAAYYAYSDLPCMCHRTR